MWQQCVFDLSNSHEVSCHFVDLTKNFRFKLERYNRSGWKCEIIWLSVKKWIWFDYIWIDITVWCSMVGIGELWPLYHKNAFIFIKASNAAWNNLLAVATKVFFFLLFSLRSELVKHSNPKISGSTTRKFYKEFFKNQIVRIIVHLILTVCIRCASEL